VQSPTKARNETRWRAQKTSTQLKLTNLSAPFQLCASLASNRERLHQR